jgi:hypothetical protein
MLLGMANREIDADTVRKIDEIHAMLTDLKPLVDRAAPLLDSPMARMATSRPGATVLSLMARGPRG